MITFMSYIYCIAQLFTLWYILFFMFVQRLKIKSLGLLVPSWYFSFVICFHPYYLQYTPILQDHSIIFFLYIHVDYESSYFLLYLFFIFFVFLYCYCSLYLFNLFIGCWLTVLSISLHYCLLVIIKMYEKMGYHNCNACG